MCQGPGAYHPQLCFWLSPGVFSLTHGGAPKAPHHPKMLRVASWGHLAKPWLPPDLPLHKMTPQGQHAAFWVWFGASGGHRGSARKPQEQAKIDDFGSASRTALLQTIVCVCGRGSVCVGGLCVLGLCVFLGWGWWAGAGCAWAGDWVLGRGVLGLVCVGWVSVGWCAWAGCAWAVCVDCVCGLDGLGLGVFTCCSHGLLLLLLLLLLRRFLLLFLLVLPLLPLLLLLLLLPSPLGPSHFFGPSHSRAGHSRPGQSSMFGDLAKVWGARGLHVADGKFQ